MSLRTMVTLFRWIASSLIVASWSTPMLRAQQLAVAPAGPIRLTFDIATIRPAPVHDPNEFCYIHSMPTGQGYVAHCARVRLMISLMYKIPVHQITGGPAWLDSDEFDIEAKADKVYNLDDLHTMYQNMLADRFGLKFHTETKQGNIYALTVDSAGLPRKLRY